MSRLSTDRLKLRGHRLRLQADRLYVSVEPETVAVCRVQGVFKNKLVKKDLLACDPSYGSAPWDGAVEALKKHLEPLKAERLNVTVVLSNRLVRYALVPFDAALSGPEEELALARFHFTRIYGERAKAWDLRISEGAAGGPRIASGVDEGLVKALRACFPSTGRARLVSVQPYLMAAFNRWRSGWQSGSLLARGGASDKDGAWLVLLERERACFALASRAGWQSVQSLRLENTQDVFELLERESLRSGSKIVKRATIHGRATIQGAKPGDAPDWQLSPLGLARLEGYSPLDDGRYAMALCAR